MTEVLAIIPARGGSKGIPRKNLAPCGGRPLVDWTIEAANDSRRVTDAILSSDDHEINERATGRVRAVHRHPLLAQDDTSTEAVIASLLPFDPPDIVVLLQPTSPLRTGAHIDEAVQLLEDTWQADSVVSVVPSHAYLWAADGTPLYTERRRRQEMRQFEENGAIYAFTMEHWRRTGNRLGGHVELYVMGEEHRLQVDTPDDLEAMSRLLERAAVPA